MPDAPRQRQDSQSDQPADTIIEGGDFIQDAQDLQTSRTDQDTHRSSSGLAEPDLCNQEQEPSLAMLFPEFVMEAQQWNEHMLDGNDDKKDGQGWLSPLWVFTRLIKGHPVVAGLNAGQALGRVDAVFRSQGKAWSDFFDVASDEDATTEFLRNWDKVRYIPGSDPLDSAAALAKELLDKPAIRTGRFNNSPGLYGGYNRFVALAGCLQVVAGDNVFWLPCERVGRTLKVSEATVSTYRKWAVEDGYLKVVQAHKFRSAGRSKATEFRFDVSRFPELAVRAQKGCAESFRAAGNGGGKA